MSNRLESGWDSEWDSEWDSGWDLDPDSRRAGEPRAEPDAGWQPEPQWAGRPLVAWATVRRARRAVTVGYCAQGVCFAALVTRIPAVQARFALSETALAAVLVVVPVIAGLAGLTAGALAARFTGRRVLRIAGPAVPLSVLAVGLAPSPSLLLTAFAMAGMALGAVDALLHLQGVQLQSSHRRPVMASLYAAFSVAGIAGALLAAAGAALGLSLAIFFGALVLIVVPAQLRVGADLLAPDPAAAADLEPHREADGADRPGPLPWRGMVLIGTALACVYLLDSSVSNWSALYLTEVLDSSQGVAALAFGGYALVTALARGGAERFALSAGSVVVVRSGALTALLGLCAVTLAPSAPVALAGFALIGLGVAPTIPLAFAAAAALSPDAPGRVITWINACNYLGVIAGAPLVGLVAGRSSMRWGVAALLPAAMFVVLLAPALQPGPADDSLPVAPHQ